jgi:hypothetical protein
MERNNVHIWNFTEGAENRKAIFSPLNGTEPKYDPAKWNNKKSIIKTHNCYAYVFDIINNNFKSKPQPGYMSGYLHMSDDDIRSCDKLMERIKADNPSVIKSDFESKCPRGYRKGYVAVDTSDNPDYHFYRLDNSGIWSHKPGATEARMENYDGKIILRPDKAKRESNSHYYDKSCGYFCFDPNLSKISNKPAKNIRKGGGKKSVKKIKNKR